MSDTRLRINPNATFQFIDANTVRGRARDVCEFDVQVYNVIQCFAEARTLAEVYAELDTDSSLEDFAATFRQLVDAGLLHAEGNSGGADERLRTLWNRTVFEQESTLQELASTMQAGTPVVIREPFAPDFADRIHAELEAHSPWPPHERAMGFFHYRHHNIYESDYNPPALHTCRELFSAPLFRSLVARLAADRTDGPTDVTASYYCAGDYSLPHEDQVGRRSVAFIWYLTRAWRPEWGGHFYWCPTGTYVKPSFNTLLMFRVSRTSSHFVCPVAPQVQSKRLAVGGWWTRAASASEPEPVAQPRQSSRSPDEELFQSAHPPRRLAEGVWSL
jgi:hypothetical protein